MRKTLKALIAVICVLLVLAVALLIYLEHGKPDENDPSEAGATDVITSTEADGNSESESTEEAPVETYEGGVPNYNWSEEETTADAVPEESGTPAGTDPYIPDEDELPQLPL